MPQTQHPPQPPIPSHSDLPLLSKPTSSPMHGLGHLLMTRPLIIVGGMWVSLFLIALVAVGGLLSPGASERRSVSTTVIGSDSAIATQPMPQQARVPLWMFGAIALTCTAGSILVSRQLNRPATPPRRLSRRKSRSFQRLQPQPMAQLVLPPAPGYPPSRPPSKQQPLPRSVQPHLGQPLSYRPVSPVENLPPAMPSVATTPSPVAPRPVERNVLPPLLNRSSTQPKAVQPQAIPRPTVKTSVNILPPDIRKPLDWQTTELASAVDLRRRRSLSSLL